MRIAEYKQIDVEKVPKTIIMTDYDEDGTIIGMHEEVVYEDKPIMALVYRDATEEEMQIDVPIELTEEATTIEDVVEALGILSEIVLGGE